MFFDAPGWYYARSLAPLGMLDLIY